MSNINDSNRDNYIEGDSDWKEIDVSEFLEQMGDDGDGDIDSDASLMDFFDPKNVGEN